MKKILLIMALGMMTGLSAAAWQQYNDGNSYEAHLQSIFDIDPTELSNNFTKQANLFFVSTSITIWPVLILSIKYWKAANKTISLLKEEIEGSDKETVDFINKTIHALSKGKKLVRITCGIFFGLTALSYSSLLATDKNKYKLSLLSSTPGLLKTGFASYFAYSINKDIKMIKQQIALDDNDENALSIENLDEALNTLQQGRFLALTIAALNGIESAWHLSFPFKK